MTTIVANLECMAADQRCTDDAGPLCHVKKIHRVGDSLFGLAGDAFIGLVIIEWLGTKRNRLQLYKMFGDEAIEWRYETSLLELSPAGLAVWNGWGLRMPILDPTYGIGTGADAALTAMDKGCSPEDAIRSVRRDPYSGLFSEPQVEYLLPPELARKVRRKRGA